MKKISEIKLLTCSDRCISVEFGTVIDQSINAKVHALYNAIEAANVLGVTELIPTYRSLGVCYDPLAIGEAELKKQLFDIASTLSNETLQQGRLVKIPVLYGGEYGPDLKDVAQLNKISEQDVIDRHSAVEYPIYMLGFLPGFCYLGGMDKSIATPRLSTPRVTIAPGSVGIAGEQTGIYPIASPGGWRLIGRTPIKLYDPQRKEPILLKAGMRLKFEPIDKATFDAIVSGERRADEWLK